jgi:lipid-binding SYLF domain-containing protein
MRVMTITASVLLSAAALLADTAQQRLGESATVLSEIMGTPDKGIPQDLLGKAQCMVIVPNLKKAAFIIGGEYGRGFAICRQASGTGWGAPAAVRVEGGSVGFQIGGESADVVMLVMSRKGMDKLLEDKFTLGAGASVAAGPVGRTADAKTDAQMEAEILAWSRTKGLFAGISLNGATLRNDLDQNAELYGKKMTNKEVLTGNVAPPAAAAPLIAELNRYSKRAEGSAGGSGHDPK